MRRFHHVGIITEEVQPGEIYVPQTRVHVTNPSGASLSRRILAVRARQPGDRTGPQPAAHGLRGRGPSVRDRRAQVLLGPFRAMEGLLVVFVLEDGAVFEFMQFEAPSAFDAG